MKYNILVFPCGSQVGIDVNFALRNALRINLYGASSVEDHGRYIYKNYINGLPNIADSNFIIHFNSVLKKYKIDFIIPTHDTVALFLKKYEHELFAKVIVGNLETVNICRYKALTYEHFKNDSFVPLIYHQLDEVEKYPVFLKPNDGQGGKDTFLVTGKEELIFLKNKHSNHIICEYLPGNEVSVDCFTDKNGELRVICPRTRSRVLAGISVNSKIIELSEEIREIAQIINSKLSFRGYWFFQLKQDRLGCYKLLEIANRMAGTSALTVNMDINLALLSILDFAGIDIDINPNNYSMEIDRAFVNRYQLNIDYNRVYIDLDDTLIINESINTQLLMFLYQCVNNQYEIILITKHEKDVKETLNKYKISLDLFSEIIWVDKDDKKFKYMKNDIAAIFIDNSFAERQEVRAKLNIPSFDVNNVECLVDWRG